MFRFVVYIGMVWMVTSLVADAYAHADAHKAVDGGADVTVSFEARAAGKRAVIAVDIDETLCVTDYEHLLWGIGSDNTKPLPGAAATLRRLAKSFDILYVTARCRSLAGKTERWLEQSGFPKGRLVMSGTIGGYVFQSGFKRRALSRLRREYPNLVVGIGDKAADAKAYRVSGMLPVVVNPWPRQKYRTDDVVLGDWAEVSAFFDANLDVLSDPVRMNESFERGHIWASWSGGGESDRGDS